MPQTLFVLQLASTWAMVGLIWFVQVVHYPLFGSVGEEQFAAYEQSHQQRTGLVVIPLMLTELLTAAAMLGARTTGTPRWAAVVGLVLLGVIWASTFAIQVPAHEKLGQGFSSSAHRLLVGSNWIRTFAWTARGLLLGWVALKSHG